MTDPITLEVLRYRLEAICEEAGLAIERTAISTVVVESKDFGVMICDPLGGLVVAAGVTQTHFYAAQNAISAAISRHGDDIHQGDVFAANDPHNGGGLHPQDVVVMEPVFVAGQVAAWVVATAHMMDMGGMVPGSFAPAATECYQEAIRFPPVRLVRGGEEVSDVWTMIFNNIRLANLVELDLRGLMAGCHIARTATAEVIASFGTDGFLSAVDEICDRSATEFRRRILQIADGVYEAVGWNEWNEELYEVPCRLTVSGDRLTFDFDGASPQAPHFFNSKPFIIKSELGVEVANYLGQDLPYNRGLFEVFDVLCPEGTIVNCHPPAPIGFGHVEVSFNAVETATRALLMAVAASPGCDAARYLTGPTTGSATALHTWAGIGLSGLPDGWLMMEGGATGAAGSVDRDGNDLFGWMVSSGGAMELPDVEVTEAWYPIRIIHRRLRKGTAGAGRFRAGASADLCYSVSGTSELVGTVFANRRRVPLVGAAGGLPGATTRLRIERANGAIEEVSDHQQGYVLWPDDRFLVEVASSGGYGDPVDRAIDDVERDLAAQRLDLSEAAVVYGVVPGDEAATRQAREAILKDRLDRAEASRVPCGSLKLVGNGQGEPLFPGVLQRGNLAVSERTGALLARAPNHWTDGCPRLRHAVPAAEGVEIVGYLDPVSGHYLFVDVVAGGVERSFTTAPRRWTGSLAELPEVAAE